MTNDRLKRLIDAEAAVARRSHSHALTTKPTCLMTDAECVLALQSHLLHQAGPVHRARFSEVEEQKIIAEWWSIKQRETEVPA